MRFYCVNGHLIICYSGWLIPLPLKKKINNMKTETWPYNSVLELSFHSLLWQRLLCVHQIPHFFFPPGHTVGLHFPISFAVRCLHGMSAEHRKVIRSEVQPPAGLAHKTLPHAISSHLPDTGEAGTVWSPSVWLGLWLPHDESWAQVTRVTSRPEYLTAKRKHSRVSKETSNVWSNMLRDDNQETTSASHVTGRTNKSD